MSYGLWEHDPLDTIEQLTRRSSAVSPEGRLALAVLRHALLEYEKETRCPGKRDSQIRELEEWFFSTSAPRAWPFSFENLCEALELSPDWIRSRLITLAERRPYPALRNGRRQADSAA